MVVPYPCHLRSTGSSIREGFHVCRETDELAWSETLSASVGPSAEPRHHAATANVGSDLERLGMNRLRNSGLLRYAAGLCGVFFGAWLSAITSSMVPLALAASAALLCTA